MKRNDLINYYNEWIERQADIVNKSLIKNIYDAFKAGIQAAEHHQKEQDRYCSNCGNCKNNKTGSRNECLECTQGDHWVQAKGR